MDPLAKEMIKDIDKSVVLDSAVIDSPVLGKIAPTALSGGVKTLKLAEIDDLTINLRHLMDFGNGTFDICILNTKQMVHTMKELVPIAGLYV